MLAERQKKIIDLFLSKLSTNLSLTTAEVAKKFKVTPRTIQNDLKLINSKSKEFGFQIRSSQGRGLSLIILDDKNFTSYVEKSLVQNDTYTNFTQKKDRVSYIISSLIFSNRPVLSDKLANAVAVSRSQLSLDLKDAKLILKKYSLKINTKYHSGVYIEGSEQNKRLCIIRENLNYNLHVGQEQILINRRQLSDIVVNTLTSEKYMISDLTLQNLIIHIEMSLVRMVNTNILDEREFEDENLEQFSKELTIATKIYQIISNRFLIKIDKNEIVYLAINLFSKRIYDDLDPTEINSNAFALRILKDVKIKYGIDLTNDIELRINLSLHLVPLLVRARNGLLMNNALLPSIKEKLTLAYDIAVMASNMIENEYNVKLNDDECGYLAAHFSVSLSRLNTSSEDMKVLIITSNRKSECLLLKYNFQRLFDNLISVVDIVNVSDMKYSYFSDYDAIFSTTNLPDLDIYENIVKINYFFTDYDKDIIEKELLRKRECKPLLKYFDKDLFISGVSYKNKEELLKDLCNRMSEKYLYEEDLYKSVMYREEMGSTVFADTIALTHPETLFSNETILGVVVLDSPITWDEHWDEVQIVFLMNVEINKKHEIAYLYEFFSAFVQNKEYANKLLNNSTFENFRNIIANFTEQIEKEKVI